MTQQYLMGELACLIADLEKAASDEESRELAANLRRCTEMCPVAGLAAMTWRALELADAMCWDTLSKGDAKALVDQVAVCARLREFGVCSRSISDREFL